MSKSKFNVKRFSSVAAIALLPALFLTQAGAQTASLANRPMQPHGMPSTAKGDWPMYFADPSGSRYSPQDQINASNFNQLQLAWHFKTDNMGGRPEFKLEGTPLEINGTVYTTAGSRRAVIALNAKTGEMKWMYSLDEGSRAALAPRQLSGRGVSYWTDGNGDERILYVTTGYRLVSLDAHTGKPVESFGDHGIVDLKVGVTKGAGEQIDLDSGEIGLHTTPTVVKNVVLIGAAMKEGSQPLEVNNTKGLVRAFDVKTGKNLWTFRTIPSKGEPGYETWENGTADKTGNTGVWTGITVDPELDSVYLPVEDPTNDFYGGARPGDNLYGDSLVCVDLNTGKKKWHYQVIHHPIWDYDLSSPPLLVDITVKGKPIKAVALPSKQAFLYVFDRVTGKPIWPIVEKKVPQSDVPGEKTAKTQPFPTRPAPYARQQITNDDLIDFTPELRAKAVDIIKKYYKMGPMFSPPTVGKVGGPYGVLDIGNTSGGTNWPGAGFNPETHVVFAPGNNANVTVMGLVEPPPGLTNNRYLEGTAGQPFRINGGPGFGSSSDAPKVSADQAKLNAIMAAQPKTSNNPAPPRNVDGLPLVKPPYGLLTAINLDTGDTLWQVPHGDTPDEIRNNPALKGMNIPKTGQAGNVGEVITKSLVVMGDPTYSTAEGHPRGAMLRAYDQKSGQQVGAVWMPAPQSGSPMTYSYDGKQYIIVAVSGGNYSGDYLAYALPSAN